MLARQLAASLGVFVAFRVAVPAEHFAAAHVIVSVAATVGIILQRGFVRLIHGPPPRMASWGRSQGIVPPLAWCVRPGCYARVTCRPRQPGGLKADTSQAKNGRG